MMPQCYISLAVAAMALALAAYPYLHSFWEHHTRRGQMRRRLAMLRTA